MTGWSDNIETAPRGEYVLGFVTYGSDTAGRGYIIVGRVIFPKSKRLTRKAGTYNFKARDMRGTDYIATHWMPLPEPPSALMEKQG